MSEPDYDSDSGDFTTASLQRNSQRQSGQQNQDVRPNREITEAFNTSNDDGMDLGDDNVNPVIPIVVMADGDGQQAAAEAPVALDATAPNDVPGSAHGDGTIGASAAIQPKLNEHIYVNPEELVGFMQLKKKKFCYRGYRYNVHRTLASGIMSCECDEARYGCRGRLYVHLDGTPEERQEHSGHSANNEASMLIKVSDFIVDQKYILSWFIVSKFV